ncbi:hypothetical protein Tco_0580756, partial [Tanacetum coccineum]
LYGGGGIPFQLKSDSLPHAHAQTIKTYYKHQESRIKKAQDSKTKTFASFDTNYKSTYFKANSIKDSNWENEQDNGYDEKEVLKEMKKLQVNSAKSAISLRRLPKEKSRIKEEIEATMSVHCATILKDALPLKEKDLGSFTLP